MPYNDRHRNLSHAYSTDLPQKFGIPRNSFLAPHLQGRIFLSRNLPPMQRLRAWTPSLTCGCCGASKTERPAARLRILPSTLKRRTGPAPTQKWSKTVRPPRLGGAERVGVFATRSPFRPNPIGLTCVKLDRVELTDDGPIIHVLGPTCATVRPSTTSSPTFRLRTATGCDRRLDRG